MGSLWGLMGFKGVLWVLYGVLRGLDGVLRVLMGPYGVIRGALWGHIGPESH